MADAVLRERLLVGGAALALLFLIVVALVAAFVVLAWLVDRYRTEDARVTRIFAETLTTPGSTPAAPDNVPGINLADHDACELLLDDPEFAARCERLWADIRNQQKGETRDA